MPTSAGLSSTLISLRMSRLLSEGRLAQTSPRERRPTACALSARLRVHYIGSLSLWREQQIEANYNDRGCDQHSFFPEGIINAVN